MAVDGDVVDDAAVLPGIGDVAAVVAIVAGGHLAGLHRLAGQAQLAAPCPPDPQRSVQLLGKDRAGGWPSGGRDGPVPLV